LLLHQILFRMKNAEFYKKVQIPKNNPYSPGMFFPQYWWFYIPGNLLIALSAPFVRNRGVILWSDEYLHLLSISASIVVVFNMVFAWFMDIRPYLNKRKGFYWRGNFVVTGKETSMGSKYILLKPGNNHRIRVRAEFFRAVQEKDRIFLERTYLGDIMKIHKISSGYLERIRSRNVLPKTYQES
jgi:hypothetical protein